MSDDKPSDGVPTGWEPFNDDVHWTTCTVCGERFDMRKSENIGKHLHDAKNVRAAYAEALMVTDLEELIAARLASDLIEAMENLDALPPREAAANLRRTLLEHCTFYRKLIVDHPEDRHAVVERLKREQMLLALTRQHRQDPDNSLLLP